MMKHPPLPANSNLYRTITGYLACCVEVTFSSCKISPPGICYAFSTSLPPPVIQQSRWETGQPLHSHYLPPVQSPTNAKGSSITALILVHLASFTCIRLDFQSCKTRRCLPIRNFLSQMHLNPPAQ